MTVVNIIYTFQVSKCIFVFYFSYYSMLQLLVTLRTVEPTCVFFNTSKRFFEEK